jgi:hypothetical protein
MNQTETKRLISRQEAIVLLAGLDLVHCSETIKPVSISNSFQICSSEDKETNKTFIQEYKKRSKDVEHLTPHKYFKVKYQKCLNVQRSIIPHFTGICGFPVFPPSEAYAKQTMVMHTPWRDYPKSTDWIGDFTRFINSPDVPRSARMTFLRVLNRYTTKTQFVEPVASKTTLNGNDIDQETQELLDLTGLSGFDKKVDDHDVELLKSLDRGRDFKWDSIPTVSQSHSSTGRLYRIQNSRLTNSQNLNLQLHISTGA